MESHWENDKLALADAKEIVLPGMKRWAQQMNIGQFSDKALASAFRNEDLPEEIHQLAIQLAEFAGVTVQ